MFKKGEFIIALKPLTMNGIEIDRSWMDQPLEVKEVAEHHYLLAWQFGGKEITFIMPFYDVENRVMIVANPLLRKEQREEVL